ncbi:MFS general substrate transporter [Zopfia rhizophila CBS 207.26]|uniref:MFS general substrate transporter n=1 Tax=Zopfia rhizophila CBS 207.26 TaxID=1314779 RepID=A0A6A6EY30_9PEZI|nr:MFS general substrate transporter [Zopfia rhizophila CBS 207.26]
MSTKSSRIPLTSSRARTSPLRHESNEHGEWKASLQIKMILVCLSIVSLVVAIDATILVPALPVRKLRHPWINGQGMLMRTQARSYLLTSSACQPIIASLSEAFGRRNMLLLSIALFTAGSLIACLAKNFPVLLTGRTIQGIGGGGIITLNLVIMTDIIPLRQRPKYNGVSQVAWAFGSITGPLIGGAIVQYTTWQWLFYINFPFCVIGLISVPFVVKLRAPPFMLEHLLHRIDWFGSALFLGSNTSLLIGLTWAGHQYSWGSYQTLVPLFAKAPFIRKSLLRSRSLMTAYICTLIQGLLLYALMYYLAFCLSSVKAFGPVRTGYFLLPISCGLMPAIWSGWVVNTFGTGLLILLDQDSPVVAWVLIFLILGIGQGLLLSAHNFAVQAIASTEDVAYATTLFSFMRGVGLCVGVAIGGAVFQNHLRTALVSARLPTDIAADAEAYVHILLAMPSNSSMRIAVVDAYATGFRFLFEILTGISGVGLLLSLTIGGHYSLDKELDAEHAHALS